MAYEKSHPFGEQYMHFLIAQFTSYFANVNRKGDHKFSESDFLPGYEKPQKTEAEMHALISRAKDSARGDSRKHRR